jgi:hypothetical protein
MKLPMKAHTADMNRVAGMKTEVATITGRTNMRKRNICAYAARALMNVRIVSKGIVCRRVVYGSVTRGWLDGLFVRNSIMMEDEMQIVSPVHQTAVHVESLYFRLPRGT